MVKKILIGLVVIALILVLIVALQPAEFRITRTATMSAPPARVFTQVNDFRNWDKWSPWAKIDPNMEQTYEGERSGVGAVYTWAGNDEVGEGRMTISESQPPERILINLKFIKPFAANNSTEFTFRPEGDQTVVTWSMSGVNDFMGKAVNLVMNMDNVVGADFEKGMTQLKAVVEESSEKQPKKQEG